MASSQFSISVFLKAFDQMTPTLNKLSGQMDAFGKKMTGAGKRMSLAVTAPIVAAGALAFRESNAWRRSLANVATLIPGSPKRLEAYHERVRQLSLETGKTYVEIMEGAYDAVSAIGDIPGATEGQKKYPALS